MVPNFIGGREIELASARCLPVVAPGTGERIARVPLCGASQLDEVVEKAREGGKAWAATPLKERVQVLFRVKSLIEAESERLVELITLENGKTLEESRGSVARAVECLEYASSLPQIAPGRVLEVSPGVECREVRHPLGFVAGITPFNFPFMVPLWMIPLAIGLGNAFILKPSEQTPLSSLEIARLLKRAGLPDGAFSVIHGDREIVEALCSHPEIRAIAFVGSTRAARAVYQLGTRHDKRVRALGGAKNHLVAVPDADPEMTAANVTASVTGCAGQRCMAASVLLAVGETEHILDLIHEKMSRVIAGRDIGAIISNEAYERITGYVERARVEGLLRLDGRGLVAEDAPSGGRYLGPCIFDKVPPGHETAVDEIFGPTLTVIRCRTLDEAIEIENSGAYGNAAAIYTSSGGVAQLFADRADAGMIGVNIGVPVPREPFAFGGWKDSRFGGGDITGASAVDFWSRPKKVTTKWTSEHSTNWMS